MTPPATIQKIAVVSPVFNEEAVLPELLDRLARVFDHHDQYSWCGIIVDDGSQDRTSALIRDRAARDPRFRLVQLSRNFGFQAALSAGLAEAAGAAAVVTLDADLQDPPELIPELVAAWEQGAEVVRARRRSRSESGLRRAGFDLFHRTFSRISDHPVEPDTGTFGLLGAEALQAFLALPERHRFFPGLRSWIGFPAADVDYDRQDRAAGKPRQGLRQLVGYAMDGIFSFSYLPLRLLTYSGVLISGMGFSLGAFFIAKRLLGLETATTGFTTLVSLVTFLGGVQLLGIGVLGEYLARVYDEVKGRPVYITRYPRGPRDCDGRPAR